MVRSTKVWLAIGVLATVCCLAVTEIHRAKSLNTRPKPHHHSQYQYPAPRCSRNSLFPCADDDVNSTTKSWLQDVVWGHTIQTWALSILSASLVGFSGIFPLLIIPIEAGKSLRSGVASGRLKLLLSFAVGGLLGDVFLHLLPEAWAHLEKLGGSRQGHFQIGLWLLSGLLLFFMIQKVFPEDADGEEGEEEKADDDEALVEDAELKSKKNEILSSALHESEKEFDVQSDSTEVISVYNGLVQQENGRNGFKHNGIDQNGFKKNGINKNGFVKNGINKNGFVKNGIDKNVFAKNGINKNGFVENRIDKNGLAKNGFQKNEINKNGFKKNELKAEELLKLASKDQHNEGFETKNHVKMHRDENHRKNKSLFVIFKNWLCGPDQCADSTPDNLKSTHIKTSGWLNLMANMIDNFTHGLAVAGSYSVNTKTGLLTTVAILLHEVPHEIGDFAILLRAGFDRWKAAKAQLLTATGGMIGALLALAAESTKQAGDSTAWILPFTAGGFLYIALVNIVPDLQKENNPWNSLKQLLCLCCGIATMAVVTVLVE